MGFGVDLMALAALVTEPLPLAQTSLTETNGKIGPEALIDRLVNRLGARAVRRLVPRASHIPELAQSLRSAFAGPSLWPAQPEKPPRPPLLFASPEPLTVLAEIPEGPPARFTWRHVTRRVVKAEGPERIAPEWWRALTRVSHGPEDFASSLPTHSPLPPCGGARAHLHSSSAERGSEQASAEGGASQTQNVLLTPLPTLPHKGEGEQVASDHQDPATITASRTRTGTATGCSAKAFIRRASMGCPLGICTVSSDDGVRHAATPSSRSPPTSPSSTAAPIPRSWWRRHARLD